MGQSILEFDGPYIHTHTISKLRCFQAKKELFNATSPPREHEVFAPVKTQFVQIFFLSVLSTNCSILSKIKFSFWKKKWPEIRPKNAFLFVVRKSCSLQKKTEGQILWLFFFKKATQPFEFFFHSQRLLNLLKRMLSFISWVSHSIYNLGRIIFEN